jgi:hypothetical protein
MRCRTLVTEFLQKSHIAAFDLTYDLTANWSVGAKYAYRLGQASLDRMEPEVLRQRREARGVALGPAVLQDLGEHGRTAIDSRHFEMRSRGLAAL